MAVVKIGSRGQLTIPASLRNELRSDKGTTFSIVNAGEALVLTRELKKTGLTLEGLLRDLEKQRRRYTRERDGG